MSVGLLAGRSAHRGLSIAPSLTLFKRQRHGSLARAPLRVRIGVVVLPSACHNIFSAVVLQGRGLFGRWTCWCRGGQERELHRQHGPVRGHDWQCGRADVVRGVRAYTVHIREPRVSGDIV